VTTKRDAILGLVAGAVSFASLVAAPRAGAEESVSETEANEALRGWLDAVFTGDPVAVDKVVAPEFQILRSDGTGYNKAGYLAAPLPKQKSKPKASDIVATGHGDMIVMRYLLETEQTINGKLVEAISPRLSVFRKEDGRWLISAHANLAKIG
jgi:ketosteroid isomerase-like protein